MHHETVHRNQHPYSAIIKIITTSQIETPLKKTHTNPSSKKTERDGQKLQTTEAKSRGTGTFARDYLLFFTFSCIALS